MPFVIVVSHGTKQANKLQKDISDWVFNHNRQLIDDNELPVFKANLLAGIAELNAQYSRCKPVHADFWVPGDEHCKDEKLTLSAGSFVEATIYYCCKHSVGR